MKPDDEKEVKQWQDAPARSTAGTWNTSRPTTSAWSSPTATGKEWLRIAGVKLPPEVLEKFYHANAERLIPALAKNDKP